MISIIMPTYNRKYIIQRAIDSVLMQSYKDWELIIVDDGSTDDTESQISANHDKRIRYVKLEKNMGANHARNVGMKIASGNYFMFLDSDSTYENNWLENCASIIQNTDCHVVFSKVKFVNMDSTFSIAPKFSDVELNNEAFLLKKQLVRGVINTNTVCMKKEIFAEMGGFDENLRRLQEREFFLRVCLSGKYKIKFLDFVSSNSFMMNDSISARNDLYWPSLIYIIKKHINEYRRYKCIFPTLNWTLDAGWPVSYLINDKKCLSLIEEITKLLNTEETSRLIEELLKRNKNKIPNRKNMVFPYQLFDSEDRVLIYGSQELGKQFYRQGIESGYVHIVGIIDENKEKLDTNNFLSYPIEDIKKIDFDKILIAIKDVNQAKKAKKLLMEEGVVPEIILWQGCNYDYNDFMHNVFLPIQTFHEIKNHTETKKFAYELPGVSIAFMSAGSGLGDAVISKKVYEEILKMVPYANVDIYSIDKKNISYSRAFYYGEKNIKNILEEGLYKENYNKYDLAIRVWHFLEIDSFRENKLPSDIANSIKKIISYNKDKIQPIGKNQYVIDAMENSSTSNVTRYSIMNCDGSLPIHDKEVEIRLNPSFQTKFDSLNLNSKKYITINIGSGNDTNRVQLKEWPLKYYEELVQLIKEKYINLHIVQLGGINSVKIGNVNQYILGEDIELVEYVLKNSQLHIDCEGGLVHLATQLRTKCTVIFGPTPIAYFAYSQNINITANSCTPCCWKWKDAYTCMRGDKTPPRCMSSVTPNIVYEQCKDYLDKTLFNEMGRVSKQPKSR